MGKSVSHQKNLLKELKKPGYLIYKSDAEINYIIFGIPSKTYFLELYNYLLSFFEETVRKNYKPTV